MTEIYIVVPGRPVPKARPRVTQRGTYTHERTVQFERQVMSAALASGWNTRLEGPLAVEIDSVFPRPRRLRTADPWLLPHSVRPDADNLAKAVLDGLGRLIRDEEVAVLTSRKWYAETGGEARTEVRVRAHIEKNQGASKKGLSETATLVRGNRR